MRLFYLCNDPGIPPDGTKGASIHLRSLAVALSDLGHEVTMFTRRPPARPDQLPVRWASVDALENPSRGVEEYGAPNVVLERYALGSELGIDAARRLGCRFCLEVNAPLVDEQARYRSGARDPEHSRVERRLLAEADQVVCVSRPLAKHIARLGGRAEVHVVPNGHHPGHFPDSPIGTSAEPDPAFPRCAAFRLAFLGHPKPWHGAKRLPRIVRLLREEGHDVELMVIGGGRGVETLVDTVRDEGVQKYVHLTGPVRHEEAIRLLVACDVSLAPYPEDAGTTLATEESTKPVFYFCPIKIIESMAAGVPVVASDLGDNAALLEGGGVLVRPDEDSGFVDAVGRLLRDPAQRSQLAERAWQRARSELTWERTAMGVLAALQQVPDGECAR